MELFKKMLFPINKKLKIKSIEYFVYILKLYTQYCNYSLDKRLTG